MNKFILEPLTFEAASFSQIPEYQKQFEAHKNIGKVNGLTDEQIAEIEKLIK